MIKRIVYMIQLLITIIATVWLAFVSIANSAEFKVLEDKSAIVLIGKIEEGDGEKLQDIYLLNSGKPKYLYLWMSPGGNLNESIAINYWIRQLNINTFVPPNSRCYSACAFIWLGGKKRIVGEGADIRFHKPFLHDKINDLQLEEELNWYLAWFIGFNRLSWRMYDDLIKKTDKEKYIKFDDKIARRWGIIYWRLEK